MAIDRTAYNALVDDSGNGLTGSIWNKAAIKNVLLDPTDAALAPPWQVVPFNVANFWPTIAAGHIQINRYVVMGKVLFWQMNIAGGNVPSPATNVLPLKLPGGLQMVHCSNPATYCVDGTVINAYLNPLDAFTAAAQKTAGGNFTAAPGGLFLFFTLVVALA